MQAYSNGIWASLLKNHQPTPAPLFAPTLTTTTTTTTTTTITKRMRPRFLFITFLLLLFQTVLCTKPSPSPNPAEALFTALQSADLTTHLDHLLQTDATTEANHYLTVAERYANNRDPLTALKYLRLSAALGSSEAHSTAASLLLIGDTHVNRDVSTAVQHLRHAARRGQPDAQSLLGFLYASGIADRFGIEKNFHKALLNWAFAAAAGNIYGTTALAFRYLHGIGVTKSCETAAKYYQRAANAIATDPRYWPTVENFLSGKPPLPDSLTNSARLRFDEQLLQGNDLTAGDEDLIQFYTHSAEKGDIRAMTTLGGLHFFGGYGLQPDENAAREYLEMAAAELDGEAQGMLGHLAMRDGLNETAIKRFRYSAGAESRIGHYALGMIFFHGLLGMQKDFSKAHMHFTLASEKKHPEASFHLGLLSWRGLGVEKSYEEAFRHFQEGARLGNIQCKLNVGSILLDGTRPLKRKNCQLGVKYLKSVAEQGEWHAVFELAVSAFDENDWYATLYRHLQAAYAGIEIAQYNAAMLYERIDAAEFPELQHWDRQRFLEEAHELYDYSGVQGYTDAFVRSANVRYEERKEYVEAANTYERAARMNNTEGMVTLALLHARGLGIPENRSLALAYLNKAANYAEAELPSFIACIGLRLYWALNDVYEKFAYIFIRKPEKRLMERPPTQKAIAGSERVKRAFGIGVVSKMEIVEEVALVGALCTILFAVLVVRSKRLARQQAVQRIR